MLQQPAPLLALYLAARKARPIVCLNVQGGGYDFGAARELLTHLAEQLGGEERAQLSTACVTRRLEAGASGSRSAHPAFHLVPPAREPVVSTSTRTPWSLARAPLDDRR